MKRLTLIFAALLAAFSCVNENNGQEQAPRAMVLSVTLDGKEVLESFEPGDVSLTPTLKLEFSREIKIDPVSVACLSFTGGDLLADVDPDSPEILVLRPAQALNPSTKYRFGISKGVGFGVDIIEGFSFSFTTAYDTSDKFPQISDDELFDKVQKQTFKYFWDYAHPTSGLARERLGSGDTVAAGGSGFGIMAIIVGVERGWIARTEGAARILQIANFLAAADRFHGAW
ncbi:MAG: hypothetical protein IKS71_00400, partial [Bacteroidales bacterium]|nr:hypothetical protein [Bacteroidales bacterium]